MLLTQIQQTNKITALYMGQTDSQTGLWFPIKKMTWDYIDGEYLNCVTGYTNGAKKLREMHPDNPHLVGFGSLDRLRRDKDISHCSFANRMPLSRIPEKETVEVLGLDSSNLEQVDPVEYVSRSGGYRYGDPNDLFPEILPDSDGFYNFYFLPISSYQFARWEDEMSDNLEVGEQLNPVLIENQIQLQYQNTIVGSTPRYITKSSNKFKDALTISVAKVNLKAPKNYRFLCRASLHQSNGVPFSDLEYQVADIKSPSFASII